MRQHALHLALAFGNFSDFGTGGGSHSLIRASLEEFPNPDAASITGRAAGWENVIGADGFVPVSNRGFFSDEERTVIGQVTEEIFSGFDVQLQVFGGVLIAQLHGL